MSKESSYIPASELADMEHPRISWRVNLPDYAPAEDIMVNVARLDRLAWLGGMESLRISSYSGERTQVSAETSGINAQGTATAMIKASIAKAETQKSNISGSNAATSDYNLKWSKAHVSLNVPEIDERVSQKAKLRDPKRWSKELGKAVSHGLRDSGWDSLIGQSSSKHDVPLAFAIFTAMNLPIDGFNDVLIRHDLTTYAMYGTVWLPLLDKIFRHIKVSDRKHTLIPGYPLDRYVALNALSRIPSIKAKQ